jgi:SAM-dependent methyltransferase
VPLLRDEEIASAVAERSRVLVVGTSVRELAASIAARGCEVRRYELPSDRGVLSSLAFDAIVVTDFPDALPQPVELLRDLGRLLASNGCVLLDVARVAPAAVRATVFGGARTDEPDATPTETDAALYGKRSVAALLEEAGLVTLALRHGGSILEAAPRPAAAVNGASAPAHALHPEPLAPDAAARLRYAEKEVAALRAFFSLIHDNQRNLQIELARMRRLLGERTLEIDALRNEAARNLGRVPADDPRDAQLERLTFDLREARATIADLEARIARLRDAIVELRDRDYASTE